MTTFNYTNPDNGITTELIGTVADDDWYGPIFTVTQTKENGVLVDMPGYVDMQLICQTLQVAEVHFANAAPIEYTPVHFED